jgi:hypothetical protein
VKVTDASAIVAGGADRQIHTAETDRRSADDLLPAPTSTSPGLQRLASRRRHGSIASNALWLVRQTRESFSKGLPRTRSPGRCLFTAEPSGQRWLPPEG